MRRLLDYKHISAWCRLNNINYKAGVEMRRLAAKERAPIDAVYREVDLISFPPRWTKWVTYGECGKRTQMALDVELNRGRE